MILHETKLFPLIFNLQSMAKDEVGNEVLCCSTDQRIFHLGKTLKILLLHPLPPYSAAVVSLKTLASGSQPFLEHIEWKGAHSFEGSQIH